MKLSILPFLILANPIDETLWSIGTEPIPANFDKAMALKNPTHQQLESILLLCDAYNQTDANKGLVLAQNTIALTKNNADRQLHIKALLSEGEVYRILAENTKSEQSLKEAKRIAASIKAEYLTGKANSLLGSTMLALGKYEVALAYYISAAKSFSHLNKKKDEAAIYGNICGIFFDTNELNKLQDYLTRMHDIGEALDNDKIRIDVAAIQANYFMHAGIIYYTTNEGTISKEIRHEKLTVYFKQSEQEYYRGLELAKKTNAQKMVVVLLNNLVALMQNMGNLDKALETAKELESRATALGAVNLLIQSKFNLASIYHKMGQLDKSAAYGEESLALAQKHDLERKVFLAQRILYDLYKETGQYEKAILVLEQLRAYDNKIGNAQRNKALAEVEAQYQTVKKEKQILELAATKAKIEKQRNIVIGGTLVLGVLGFLGFRLNKVRKDRNNKKALAKALMSRQEEERKRIARDLHDGVGQSLLLLKKQMASSSKTTADNQKMIAETLDEVRAISRDLHPFQLEKFGLTAAIQDVIDKVEQSTELFISRAIDKIDGMIPKKEEIYVFRAIQEALNNVIKHAEATAVKVSIQVSQQRIIFKVLDNGKGYNFERTNRHTNSLGLRTMQERIAFMGGKMSVKNNLPSGTVVTFIVPRG